MACLALVTHLCHEDAGVLIQLNTNSKVCVVTYLTSPYQVEFFNAIHLSRALSLHIVYLYASSPIRQWSPRPIEHPHIIVNDHGEKAEASRQAILQADLAVFNFYNHSLTGSWMAERSTRRLAWCFWGERPGYRRFGWIGRIYRRWKLRTLYHSHAAIWGIGRFALTQYQHEFGNERVYHNVPYYSNLTRFGGPVRLKRAETGVTTFLFSGALIHRKGVDLLVDAFLKLRGDSTNVRLRFLGSGPERTRLEQRLRLCAGVEFLGFRDWDALPAEYRKADVLCVPSRHDGWGLVVPEALASGMPVIASTRTGAALDLINPGKNGWLVSLDDRTELLHAMRAAAALSDSTYAMMSERAAESVGRHSLSRGVDNFVRSALAALAQWPTRQNPLSIT